MDRPLPLKEAGTAEQEEDEEEDDRQAAKHGHQDLKGGSSSSIVVVVGIYREMAVVLDMHIGMQSMQAEGEPLRNGIVKKNFYYTFYYNLNQCCESKLNYLAPTPRFCLLGFGSHLHLKSY